MRNNVEYKTDTTTIARIVANPRPKAIATAIETKNASGNSGAMPRIVPVRTLDDGQVRVY